MQILYLKLELGLLKKILLTKLLQRF